MSRRQLAILLKELTSVRLICPCGGVSEATLEAMDKKSTGFRCPMCGTSLHPPMIGDADPLMYLFRAMVAVSNAKCVTVEFVIPESQNDRTATQS